MPGQLPGNVEKYRCTGGRVPPLQCARIPHDWNAHLPRSSYSLFTAE